MGGPGRGAVRENRKGIGTMTKHIQDEEREYIAAEFKKLAKTLADSMDMRKASVKPLRRVQGASGDAIRAKEGWEKPDCSEEVL